MIELIGKPMCHLCDDARAVVSTVCDGLGLAWQEVSILDDPALYDEFWERIPVVRVDGRIVAIWRVSAADLHEVLTEYRT